MRRWNVILGVVLLSAPAFGQAIQWTRIADLPTYQGDSAGGMVDGKLHVAGGLTYDPDQYPYAQDNLQIYDPSTNSWANGPTMNVRRRDLGAGVIVNPAGQQEFYAIGGYTGYAGTSVVERYATGAGWQTVAGLSHPGASVMSAVVDNKLYAMGGYENYDYCWATNEVYDQDNDRWVTKSPITRSGAPFTMGSGLTAVWDHKILVFGGTHGENQGLPGEYNQPLSSTLIYDTITDAWMDGLDMPRHRQGETAVTWDDRIYLIGGYSSAGDAVRSIDVYDPVHNTWSFGGDYPGGNYRHPLIIQDGSRIYAIGDADHSFGGGVECWMGIIPEPGTLALLGFGALLLRRR